MVATGLLATSVAAQSSLPFPLQLDGQDSATGVTRLAPQSGLIGELLGQDAIVLTDAPLPGGPDLLLQRIDHESMGFTYYVDGQPAPGVLDGTDLTVWKGSLIGSPNTEVMLSFSNAGSRGWVHNGTDLYHFMPQPGPSGAFGDGSVFLVTETELIQLGADPNWECKAGDLMGDLERHEFDGVPTGQPSGSAVIDGGSTLYGCEIAIETDYQLNQVFNGDLAAESAYITTLWAAVSDRYTEQIDTILTFPYVQFYTSPADPWSTPGSGGSLDMLDEFVNAWQGNIPNGARVGHFVSGANLGGGVAYLEILCDSAQNFSFAVSGNIDGLVPFPVAVGPTNWDFMVTAHETGHNFASPHTHDYSPQIDDCNGGACITDGTIMSYCHLCPGGLSNITTFFHPTVVNVMKSHVEDCLDVVSGIVATAPTLIAPGVATTLVAEVAGTPTGAVEMSYRFDSGSTFTTIPMTSIGADFYSASLPAAACGDMPEVFFGYTDASAGPQTTETFSIEVGNLTTFFADDFEADLGWAAGIPGDDASTGQWERGDPIGTSAQPATGAPVGTGTNCYFTGQGSSGGSLGEADVDGGTTTLVSPTVDLSSGDARIGYWRWFSNDTGGAPNEDVLVIDVTNNGSSWTNVEVVGPGGSESSGGWFYHEFVVSDFVTPTANVQVRFRASDLGSGSLVEAAVDEFAVFRTDCEVCQPDLGFGGPGTALLELCGEELSSGSSATLSITGGPAGQPAWIGYGTSFSPTSLLGGTIVPFPPVDVIPVTLDGSGAASLSIAGGSPTAVTLYLQGIILNGTAWEITNAVSADFLP